MRKLTSSLILLPLMLIGAQWASAAVITCDQSFDADPLRLVTLDTGDAGVGSVSCGPSGVTSGGTAEGTFFSTYDGYDFVSKVDASSGSTEEFKVTSNVASLDDPTPTATVGTFETLIAGLTDFIAVFKFGGGNEADPDWISFKITDIAADEMFFADWFVSGASSTDADFTPQQALSHVTLYGNTIAVPEPSTVALMALGLAGLVIARRRKA